VRQGLVGRSDIDVVKAVLAAFAERDLERVLELASPEIEFIAATSDYAGRTGPYVGHEGIRRYFRDVAEVWDELRLVPTDYRVVGEEVLVTGRVSARSPARVVSGSTGWVWRVREGKVVRGGCTPRPTTRSPPSPPARARLVGAGGQGRRRARRR
jgi:ketosteroid isomerase-like protein